MRYLLLMLLACALPALAKEFQFDAIVHDTLPGAVLVDTISGSTLVPTPGVRLTGAARPGKAVGVAAKGDVLALTPTQALVKTANGVVAVPRGLVGRVDGRLSDVAANLPTWLPVNSTLGVPLARVDNRVLVQTLEDRTIRLRAMEAGELAMGRPVLLSLAEGKVLAREWEPGLNSQIRFSGKVQQVTARGVQVETKAGSVLVPASASFYRAPAAQAGGGAGGSGYGGPVAGDSYGSWGSPLGQAGLAPGLPVGVSVPVQNLDFVGMEGPVAYLDDGYSVPATALPPYYASAPVLMPMNGQMTTLPLGAALSYQITPDLTVGLGTPGFYPSTIVPQQAFPAPLAALPVDVRLRNGELVSLPFQQALDMYRWQRGVLVQPPTLAPEYASYPVGFVSPQGAVCSVPLQTALQLQCGQSAWYQSGDLSGFAQYPVPVAFPGGRQLQLPFEYALRMERGRRGVIVEDNLPSIYADRLCQTQFANGAVVSLPWSQALAMRRQRMALAPGGMITSVHGPARLPARFAGRDLWVPANRALHWQELGAVVRAPERHALRWDNGQGRKQRSQVAFGGGQLVGWNGGGRKHGRQPVAFGGGARRDGQFARGNGGGKKQRQQYASWNGGGRKQRQQVANWGGGGRKQRQRYASWNGGGRKQRQQYASWNGGGRKQRQQSASWNGGGRKQRQQVANWGGGGRKQRQQYASWNGGGRKQRQVANWGGGGRHSGQRQAAYGGGGGGRRQAASWNGGGGGGRHGGGRHR